MNLQKLKLPLFLICASAAAVILISPLSDLLRNGRPAEYYTHIPVIPAASAYVLFRRRGRLFRGEPGSPFAGSLAIAIGLALVVIDKVRHPALIGHVELCASGAILFLSGSFIALFGGRSFVRALFPFLFLVFMIPLPIVWMDHIVRALVAGSTWATQLLFAAFNIPALKEGPIFRLPGFDLEIARECSGIRSSIALLITSVLAGQIFLRRRWKKIVLAAAVFPVTVLKNAVRIVTLYLLSYFVDMRIIEGGFLHRSGGFIFFGLGLVMLAYLLWILGNPHKVWEKVTGEPRSPKIST
jgi:exosortase